MKKIYSIILVAASLAVAACQPKELDNIVPDDNPDVKSVKITASIEDISGTKVSYGISDDAIKPAWEKGDELFGFDANGGKFTYVVTEVDKATGEATIEPKQDTSYDPAEGTLVYGIYYPGKTVEDIKGGIGEEFLAIDLAGQSGTLETLSPAIMCATATVTKGTEGNEIRFKFANQTAIIGLKKIQVGTAETLQTGTTVNQIAIEGVVTHGSLSVVNDSLTLTPGTKASTVYAVPNPTPESWKTGGDGIIEFGAEHPVAFAVLPSTHVPTVYAYTANAAFKNGTPMSTKEMAAGHYYYMSKKLDASAEPVASLTVSGVTSKYYSVSAAFDAASTSLTDVTIILLKNCAADKMLNLDGDDSSSEVTIDLSGNNLQVTANNYIDIINGRNVRLTDSSSDDIDEQGSIISTAKNSDAKSAVYVRANSKLTMDGGHIGGPNYRALYVYGGSAIISGGKIESDNDIAIAVSSTQGSSLTVKSDTQITSGKQCIYMWGGSVTLEDGTFSNGNSTNLIAAAGETAAITIEGGKYSSNYSGGAMCYASGGGKITATGGYYDPAGLNAISQASGSQVFVSGGYFTKPIQTSYAKDSLSTPYFNTTSDLTGDNAKYKFTLTSGSSVATVTVEDSDSRIWKFAKLESAIDAANVYTSATSTITLDANITSFGSATVNNASASAVINLNGHSVASTSSPAISAASSLSLMDTGSTGELSTSGATALEVTAGETTVNSGSLVGATNAVSVSAGATLNVNGGYFYGDENGDIAGAEEGATVSLVDGWYRNEPNSKYIDSSMEATNESSTTFKDRTYTWSLAQAGDPIVDVNGSGYTNLVKAINAANTFDGEADAVTITLLDSISYNSPIDLTNANDKPIVLDLNGFKLSTETESFITTDGNLTITDNGLPKGMITSSASKVLDLTTASADVTLNGCKIESTKETGSDYYIDVAILMNNSQAKLTVTGATIYTTRGLTTISNRAGSLTISDSEISSGTESTGLIAVCNGLENASTTINSGSFYTSSATAGRPVVYTGSSANSGSLAAGSVTINDGYFYFAGDTRDVRASWSAQNDKITINGGYFAHDLTWTKDPTYGSGKSLQPIEPAETHTHATISQTLSYGYQVKETPIVNVADVNGTTYTSFEEALAAANTYDGAVDSVKLTLLSDVSVDHATFNHASKNMTLDINGHTLSGTDSAAVRYTVSKTFNIVDNGAVKGKITSTKENVVAKAGTSAATINITGCTITSSATGSDYYHDAVVYLFNSKATMNITNCVIYSTGSLTGVTVIAGTAEISGSETEISSGTSSTGLVGICAYNSTANVTIKNGCFYTSNTGSTRPAAYAASGTFTIEGGYFYGGTTSIRTYTPANFSSKFTVKGGYFNNQPLSSTYTPTYDGCSLEPVSETYTHSIKGTLNFSYQAVSSAGEASVDASTSEPVVTLGEARNGGVSF